MAWILDVDGVVWLAGDPIPGSPQAIRRLRDAGERVVFLTNNSGPTLEEYARLLRAADVEAGPDDLATSAQAAASLLDPGTRAGFVGGAGIRQALESRGVEVVRLTEHPDAVVVGRSVELDYDELAAAATAVRDGARFVATNTDPTYPTGRGPVPGAGAVVAFVAAAAGRQPEVAGKPHRPVAQLVQGRYGTPQVVIGDRADTDGAFAAAVGAPFALVLSGSTRRDQVPHDPAPDVVAEDLAVAVDQLLAGGNRAAAEGRAVP
ncbi:MAG TPA: HAD-IIA family hydrolase [Acidimicrobiales bacterium]|nr:HAD-IIA family hydrolase [Acidimicrobiales bacterium]